jgi:outer membrane protein TolC
MPPGITPPYVIQSNASNVPVSARFEVGFASIVDVTTAQAALVQAQSLRAQAIVNVELRKRAVGYALGLDPTTPLQ